MLGPVANKGERRGEVQCAEGLELKNTPILRDKGTKAEETERERGCRSQAGVSCQEDDFRDKKTHSFVIDTEVKVGDSRRVTRQIGTSPIFLIISHSCITLIIYVGNKFRNAMQFKTHLAEVDGERLHAHARAMNGEVVTGVVCFNGPLRCRSQETSEMASNHISSKPRHAYAFGAWSLQLEDTPRGECCQATTFDSTFPHCVCTDLFCSPTCNSNWTVDMKRPGTRSVPPPGIIRPLIAMNFCTKGLSRFNKASCRIHSFRL